MTDLVNHPPHYTQGKTETIEIIEEIVGPYPNAIIGGCVWQVVKYLSRAPHKNDLLGDLKKSQWYLNRAIAHLEHDKKS